MATAPSRVRDLVEQFHRNRDEYRLHGLNETQLRREYLDPFFETLGWDVANRQGYAPAYREVIHEDAVKIGGVEKAPDYSFRIGGIRKFFVEAKNPAINLKDNPAPAYQLRRYAWSAKLPLSILTDFEEFVVYDCRTRPSPTDKTSAHRNLYLTYDQYDSKWDEIASVFAKDAILKGSFDKYAAEERKRGTATVDAAFLADIEDWREMLAKNLAVRNRRISVHDLNFAVQRTIDRIIFLRICEDRGAELYGQLQALLNGVHTYARLTQLFRQADDRYNSGIFHFEREAGRAETPDELTLELTVDDKVLKEIIGRLYAPKSPYEFSVFPIEILGQVYEQFLGKVIRLTAGHQAKVEEKPEVKKAGGVYYTPAYIVDYIVKQTVGVLCQDKTPKQISKLRILDPACGSGSFLIGAYQYLLAFHRDWYVKDGQDKHKKELYQTATGDYRLTTQEKKRILLNNIYGVDIDPQAVEVTKLSLLLKVLEGESEETLKRQLSFVKERALPDLGRNIKCGNSLISPDFFSGEMFPDEEKMRRINPFDWHQGFPEIMKAGGFDAVIGNPPYVRIGNIDEAIRPYLYKKYDVTHRFDIYVVFILKAFELLSLKGRFGFIVPNKFFTTEYGKDLRRFLSSSKAIQSIVDFGDSQVFLGASTYTCLLFLGREPQTRMRYQQWRTTNLPITVDQGSGVTVDSSQLGEQPWSFVSSRAANLLNKLRAYPSLGELCNIERGLETGFDDVFFFQSYSDQESTTDSFSVTSKANPKPFKVERSVVRRLVKGSLDLRRYVIENSGRFLLFPYGHANGAPFLIGEGTFKSQFPLAWKYLKEHQGELKDRKKGEWYAFRRRNYDLRDGVTRILVPSIGRRLSAACDFEGRFHFVGSGGGGGGAYGLLLKSNAKMSYDYILGILNSRLADWLAKLSNSRFGGGYYSFNRQYIEPIPIPPINFSHSTDKAKHDKMVTLVERMLDLHKRRAAAKNPNDQSRLQSQIDGTDREIDRLVYDLYGLTEDEIAIVEASGESGRTGTAVASKPETCEDVPHEDPHRHSARPPKAGRQAARVAEGAQHARQGGGGSPQGAAGPGEPVHGIREPTRQYGSPEDPLEGEGGSDPLGFTRYFETAEGRLSYAELSERLAVPLVGILDEILQSTPDEIKITSEWLCVRHKRLAGHLFPDWAGRFRDLNVQVGAHAPPPFYEVPVLMRQFCDDLTERLQHIDGTAGRLTDLLAWTDWRVQWIHPFKDFNGRIGRVLLAALLFKLRLPHVETAPLGDEARTSYLDALHAADAGNLEPLKAVWFQRLLDAL